MSDTTYSDEKAVPLDAPRAPSVPSSGKTYSGSIYDPSKESIWTRIGVTRESFKRAPGSTHVKGDSDIPPEFLDHDKVQYQQTMKPRHLQMIAVAGTIGTGLFVGSGSALSTGGPAGILIAWAVVGVMLMNVTQALGEMSIIYPVSGGFYTLASRMLDPAFAFAMGWNYLIQWAIILPLELTVANTTVQYWSNSLTQAEWITIFYVVILIAVVFGTIGFAEEEFWSSLLRIIVALIFLIIGIVCICGGGPKSGDYNHYIGGSMWQNPGAFANGFKGVCSVFVTAAFSFSGTELVGLAAAETPNPGKTIPTAVKQTFWRVTMVYIVCLTIIGLAIPYDDPRLYNGTGASSSPFVILMVKAHINGVDHLVNATILIAVLSIGLSAVYAGSRMLTAIAETGYAPRCFTYIDKAGRPLWSLVAICAFGPIAYANCADVGGAVFDWLLALSGLSTLFTWLAITVTHIRFRRAWKVQGHSVDELPYRAFGGVYGSWLGSILIVLVVIAQFYTSIWPIGEQPHGAEAASIFFQTFLSLPILIAMWIGGYLWKRTLPKRAHDIDLDTGRKSWLTAEEGRAYRAERATAPWHIKIYRFLFA
jgi:amino acid transporter